MPDRFEPKSDTCPDRWEIHLQARLEQHGLADPVAVVARWKRYRQAALARKVADLKAQLTSAQAADALRPRPNGADGSDTNPHERVLGALTSIYSRTAHAESRLRTVARDAGKAVDRLESRERELEKTLRVLKEHLPAPGQSQDSLAGGMGTVIGFGAALAVVVVALVLALSLVLRSVGA